MNRVLPRADLVALIEPQSPRAKTGFFRDTGYAKAACKTSARQPYWFDIDGLSDYFVLAMVNVGDWHGFHK